MNDQTSLPEPYRSIHLLPFDPHGWFLNSIQLGSLILKNKPKVVIEVGSWLGLSTRFIASLLPPDGLVYAVDTWLGSPTEENHMKDPRLPYLYQLFLSNVIQENLAHKIVPIRMDSIEASEALNLKADIIYIDGSHETEDVMKDIEAWYPHLSQNGVMCGDDWARESVKVAVEQMAAKLNVSVKGQFYFWHYNP